MDVAVRTVGTSTIGTDAFDEETDGGGFVAFGQMDTGKGNLFEAEGAMALLAMEMGVLVVVCRVVVALAELITDALAASFNDVY